MCGLTRNGTAAQCRFAFTGRPVQSQRDGQTSGRHKRQLSRRHRQRLKESGSLLQAPMTSLVLPSSSMRKASKRETAMSLLPQEWESWSAAADLYERGGPIGICFNELIEDGAGFRRRIQPVTLRMQGK